MYSVIMSVAAKHEATFSQVMLAALLSLSDVMIPIPGTGSVDHLRENMVAAHLELDEEDLALLWPDLLS